MWTARPKAEYAPGALEDTIAQVLEQIKAPESDKKCAFEVSASSAQSFMKFDKLTEYSKALHLVHRDLHLYSRSVL